jgi:outer membrane protein
MKKIWILLSIIIGTLSLSAQKIAYYQPQEVLDAIPEYQKAMQDIDSQVEIWKAEIKKKFQKVEERYNYFVDNENNLSAEQRKSIQDEIMDLENNAKQYKKSIFGDEGKLKQLRDKKLKPVFDKVDKAIDGVVQRLNVDFLFAKTPDAPLVRVNKDFDVTNDIKSGLGIK